MTGLARSLFLLYVVTAFAAPALFSNALRAAIVLSSAATVSAIALALLLWVLIRDFDENLGVIALSCWMFAGVVNAVQTIAMRVLLSFGSEAARWMHPLLSQAHGLTVIVMAIASAAGAVIYGFIATRPAIRTRPSNARSTSAGRPAATTARNGALRPASFS